MVHRSVAGGTIILTRPTATSTVLHAVAIGVVAENQMFRDWVPVKVGVALELPLHQIAGVGGITEDLVMALC